MNELVYFIFSMRLFMLVMAVECCPVIQLSAWCLMLGSGVDVGSDKMPHHSVRRFLPAIALSLVVPCRVSLGQYRRCWWKCTVTTAARRVKRTPCIFSY